MIEVRELTKSFGSLKAVDSLSFDIQRGEIFGIVGPDGAGKSTLLNIMSTILQPDRGSISMQGRDIFRDTYGIKENLAYMPQRFGLYEDLSVEENMQFFGKLFGVSRTEIGQRMEKLFAFSQLGPFRDRLAGNLSGGMKQKLGLACSLIHSPDVILLDEPTNGVDPVSRREFWKILYDLLGDGVTIVVSTAYLDEAERCNRVALMFEGRFIISGKPGEIKKSVGRDFVELKTSNPRHTEMLLRRDEEYKGIIMTGSTLRLFVDSVSRCKKRIPALLKREGIRVLEIREKLPTLEDCFVDIVSRDAASL